MRRALRTALVILLVPVMSALIGCSDKSAGPAPKTPSQAGAHIWDKRFGDSAEQLGGSVATDASGNVIITGYFWGTVDFGGGTLTSAGDADIFIAKFDSTGAYLWSRRFGDQDYQEGYAVAVDALGNIFVTGDFSGSVDFGGGTLASAGLEDIFVAKFSPNGAHLWSERFGDSETQFALGIAVDLSANVIVTGYFLGAVDFGGGPLASAGRGDIFIAKFDAGGGYYFSRGFGDASPQEGNGVAVDATGNITLVGDFGGTVDFGGGPLTSAGLTDVCVAKFTPGGVHLWSERFGDAGSQTATGDAVDASGNVFVVGHFSGAMDFNGNVLSSAGSDDIFVAKLTPGGTPLWSKRFGDANDQKAFGVDVDANQNAILTGSFVGAVNFGGGSLVSAGDEDIYVAKLGANGGHIWSKRFGDLYSQSALGVAADPLRRIVITGGFEGAVTFGGDVLLSTGGFDIFLAKFKP